MSDTSPITKDSLKSRRIKGTAAFLFVNCVYIIVECFYSVNIF